MNYVLEYLSSLFYYEKLLYKTIGLRRSAISAYHVHVDDKPVRQHPLVSSYLSGIFNSHPPQPKYLFVWDAQEVLNFSQHGVKQIDLEEKNLALKFVCFWPSLHHQGLPGHTIWILDLWLIQVIRSHSISINCIKAR